MVEVAKSLCARSNPSVCATARVALDVPNVADSPRTSQVVLALLLSRDLHLLHCIGINDTEDVATEALTLVVPASPLHKPLFPLRSLFPKTVDALTRTNLLGAAGNPVLSTSASVAPFLPLLANLPALAVPVLALRASSGKSKAAKLESARSKTVLRAPARVALHGPHFSDRPRTSLIVETLGGAPNHL